MTTRLDLASIDLAVPRLDRLRRRAVAERARLEDLAVFAPTAEANALLDRAEALTRRASALWRHAMALAVTRALCYGDAGPVTPPPPWPPSSPSPGASSSRRS